MLPTVLRTPPTTVDGDDDDRLSRLELLVDEQQKLLEHQGELLESLSSQKKKGSSTAHDEIEPSQSLCSRLNAASYTKPKKSAANGMHFALMCLLDDVESSWPEQYRWLALFICLLPFCVLFLQLYLLVLLMEAGTSRACNAETQLGCQPGQYCSLAFANGQCNDCSLLLDDHFGPSLAAYCPSVGYDYFANYTHPVTGVSYIGSCAMYGRCTVGDNRDKDIDRCDYLIKARSDIKVHNLVIMIIGAMLASWPMMEDMDECDTNRACFLNTRLKAASKSAQGANKIVRSMKILGCTFKMPSANDVKEAYLYTIYFTTIFIRKQMLPSLVASATVVTVTKASNAFDSVPLVLSILAVGFVCSTDNVLGKMFIHTAALPRYEAVVEALKTCANRSLRYPVRWVQNRLHALLLCASIFFESLFLEELILSLNPLFGTHALGIATHESRRYERIGPQHYDDANCNKIIFAVLTMTLFRAWLGNALTFGFDCMRTLNTYQPVTRRNRLANHGLALAGGCALTYVVFRVAVEVMEALRTQPKLFSAVSG